MPDSGWTRLSEHAYTRTLAGWKANVGLVVGTDRALLVDTGAGPEQAARLLAHVRGLTRLPLVAVNTHAHFDHVFGNAFLLDGAAHPDAGGVERVWGHERAAAGLRARGEDQRTEVAAVEPRFAAGQGPHAQILPPTHTLGDVPRDVDLGGVTATLFHLGRGHTDGDLLVGAGDVLFTGDLVEEGADPAFEDAWPVDWVTALRRIIALRDRYAVIVPGHGAVVGPEHVRAMLATLDSAVRAVRAAEAGTTPALPYGPEQARHLVSRLRATDAGRPR